MSFPYPALHAEACKHVPDGTIKPTSTWIGILLHTIKDISDIKPYSPVKRNPDFLWIKAMPKITLRTLKHEYFSRHPLEEFELKFLDVFPGDVMQVKHLKKRNPIKNSNVIVLRALEIEDIPLDIDLDEDAKIAEKVREQIIKGQTGRDPERAIVIDDEDDEEGESEDGDEQVEGESEEEEDRATEDSKRRHAFISGTKRKLVEMSEDQDNGNASGPVNDHIEYTNAAFDEAFAPVDQEMTDQDMAAPPQAEEQPMHEWQGFLTRLYALPMPAQAVFNESPWHVCGYCGKEICLKPWTRFGPNFGALCTGCTRQKLIIDGEVDGANELEHLSQEEFAKKHLAAAQGTPQNMDWDVPFDDSGSRIKQDGSEYDSAEREHVEQQVFSSATGMNGKASLPPGERGAEVDAAAAAHQEEIEETDDDDDDISMLTDEPNLTPKKHTAPITPASQPQQSRLGHRLDNFERHLARPANDTSLSVSPSPSAAAKISASAFAPGRIAPPTPSDSEHGSSSSVGATALIMRDDMAPHGEEDHDSASEASFATAGQGEEFEADADANADAVGDGYGCDPAQVFGQDGGSDELEAQDHADVWRPWSGEEGISMADDEDEDESENEVGDGGSSEAQVGPVVDEDLDDDDFELDDEGNEDDD